MIIVFFTIDSTISHLGFILLALSINTEQALDSFLFYIIQYTITNLNVFLIIIAFNYLFSYLIKNNLIIKDIKYISELTGQYYKNPILAFSLIICLLSMAGIPPFIGFYSKLYVLFAAIANSEYFIAIIAIIVSVISAYYYLRIITVIYSDNKNNSLRSATVTSQYNKAGQVEIQKGVEFNHTVQSAENLSTPFMLLSNLHSYIISILTLFLILFFLNPNLILTSTRVLSLSIFNS